MATNHAFASYSEVYDLSSQVGQPLIMGIHTPTNIQPRAMLAGFFKQFRKFKYIGCDVTFVPVSTLPVDPLNVTIEAGEIGIDPRDVVNPIIMKGFHGESLNGFLNRYISAWFPNNNADFSSLSGTEVPAIDPDTTADTTRQNLLKQLEAFYYQALADPSFQKAGIQSGFSKKGLFPLVYDMATTRPIAPYSTADGATSTGTINYPTIDNPGAILSGQYEGSSSSSDITWTPGNPYYRELLTPRMSPLGWMDCEQVVPANTSNSDPLTSANVATYTYMPKLFMYFVMMPPAYKTEFYFRMVVKHRFEFKDFRGCVGPFGLTKNNPDYANMLGPPTGGATIEPVALDALPDAPWNGEPTAEVQNGSITLTTSGVA